MFNGLLGTLGLVGGAMGLGLLAKGVMKLGADLEQTKVSFEVLTGSAEVAGKLLGKLNEYANFTPYTNSDIIDSGKLLMSYGVASEDVMGSVKMIGDIAQGSTEKLGRITLAFGQIQSTGRLMGQDLLQLVQAGFNPIKVISEQTGISMLELRKTMEKGGISAKMVSDAFKIATGPTGSFYEMAIKQSKTLGGLWSTFTGNLQYSIATIMDANSGPLKDFVVQLIEISKWAMNNQETIMKWVKAIWEVVKVFLTFKISMIGIAVTQKALAVGTAVYSLALKALTAGFRAAAVSAAAMNVAMKENLIGLAMTVVATLIMKIVELRKEMNLAREEASKPIMTAELEAANALKDSLSKIRKDYGLIKNMTKTEQNEYYDLVEATKKQAEALRLSAQRTLDNAPAYKRYLEQYKELNILKDKGTRTDKEEARFKTLTRLTTNFANSDINNNIFGKVFGMKKNEITGNVTALDNLLKDLRSKGISGSGPITFDLKPSEGVNDLTTELSTKRNIKNITLNIQQLIGVESLNTTTVTESREQIGQLILEELNKAAFQFAAQN